jgi:tetratricopeptide (TPR) repeat protein
MNRVLLFVISAVILASCHGSKYYTKLGAKQESAGMVNEAADSYYNALLKKRSNFDAQVGLKKNGQFVLSSLLSEFSKEKNFGTNRTAVDAYARAIAYRDKVAYVGVKLEIQDFYVQDYERSKAALLDELYTAGTALLEQGKYTEAQNQFDQIKKLDPNFKDTKDLGDIAYVEPLYKEGVAAMEAGEYRRAHTSFSKVIERKPEYKDTKSRMDESLQNGMFTIAMVNFENTTNQPELGTKVGAFALNALLEIKDPFLRIVDRSITDEVLREQRLQLSGVIDQNTAVQVGELVGAKALLTGTVLSYSEKKGALTKSDRDGYVAYHEQVMNKTDGKYYMQTRYKAAKYQEFYNQNVCSISFQYKLIDLKTGQILKTDILQLEQKDEVLYGKFEGNANDLWPAGQGGPNLNQSDKQALNKLMNGRQELKSMMEVTNTMMQSLASRLSTAVGELVIQKVK